MSFPSEPNAAVNDWVARQTEPLRQWCKRRQLLPDVRVFLVSETPDGLWLSLSPQVSAAVAGLSAHRLQLLDATDGATVQYRVRLGKVAGQIADPGMTDPGDDPPFLKEMVTPADGVYVIYCKLAMTYLGNGEWSPAAGEIFTGVVGDPLPDNDDDWFYVEIGQLRCADGAIAQILPAQAAKNDIEIGRRGNDTDYVDARVQQLAT